MRYILHLLTHVQLLYVSMVSCEFIATFGGGLRGKGVEMSSQHHERNGQPLHAVQFLGIPYADPPVHMLRFTKPHPYSGSWKGVKRFDKYMPDCYTGKEGTDEDCLYLNIFLPSRPPTTDKLPVVVWIYGGGFNSGRASQYNGTELAVSEDVVVVVPSYRVGAFGFLSVEPAQQQPSATAYQHAGNWGILDQRAAIKWVHENIANFGGDADRVTLMGHSAGAMAIATHITSAETRGHFSRVIMASPSMNSPYFYVHKHQIAPFSNWVAHTLAGCKNRNDLECLRVVKKEKFIIKPHHADSVPSGIASKTFPFMPWSITLDESDTSLMAEPTKLAELGYVHKIPIIVGLVGDEGSAFTQIISQAVAPKHKGRFTEEDVEPLIHHFFIANSTFTKILTDDFFFHYRPLYPLPSLTKEAPSDPRNVPASDLAGEDEINLIFRKDLSAISNQEIHDMFPSRFNDNSGESLQPSDQGFPTYDKGATLFVKQLLKDSIFTCPLLEWLSHVKDPVWVYHFDTDMWNQSPWNLVATRTLGMEGGNDIPLGHMGAYHGSEVPLLFDDFPKETIMPGDITGATIHYAYTSPSFCSPDDHKRKVAKQLKCLFTGLSHCGSPQCLSNCDVPLWEPYTQASKQILTFSGKGETVVETIAGGSSAPIGESKYLQTESHCHIWSDHRSKFDAVTPLDNFESTVTGRARVRAHSDTEDVKGCNLARGSTLLFFACLYTMIA